MEICQEPAPAMRTPLSTLYMRPLPLTLHALDSEAARFKYPPHWVPLEALFAAMQAPDGATGLPRGWLSLRARLLEQPAHSA